jgi:hypothetical protein
MSRLRRHKPVRVLVLQHDRQGGLGAYERVLSQREAEAEVVDLDRSRCLPDWRSFDAIMALGGQASIATGSPPGWLADERQYVREAVMSGVPYWGVCLGAQLLATKPGRTRIPGRKTRSRDPSCFPHGLRPARPCIREDARQAQCVSVARGWFRPPARSRFARRFTGVSEPGISLACARLRDPVPSRGLAGDGTCLGCNACLRGSARCRSRPQSARSLTGRARNSLHHPRRDRREPSRALAHARRTVS